MLGLTVQDIIGIQTALDPMAQVKTLNDHFINGANLITTAITQADLEVNTARRAARLTISIQSNQPFTNCNTRTATMFCYALLAVERQQWLRRKPYQVYAQVGHWGPIGTPQAVNQIAQFIDDHMIGVVNIVGRWNGVRGQLPGVATQVVAWQAFKPIVSSELRSWYSIYGY